MARIPSLSDWVVDLYHIACSLASAFEQYIVNLECKRQSIGIIQEKISKGVG